MDQSAYYSGMNIFPTTPSNLTGVNTGTIYDSWAGQTSPMQTMLGNGMDPTQAWAATTYGTPPDYTGGIGTDAQNEEWLKAVQKLQVPLTPTQQAQWQSMYQGSQVFNPGGSNNNLIAGNPLSTGQVPYTYDPNKLTTPTSTPTSPATGSGLRNPAELAATGTAQYNYDPSNPNKGRSSIFGNQSSGTPSYNNPAYDLGNQQPTGGQTLTRSTPKTPYEIAMGL